MCETKKLQNAEPEVFYNDSYLVSNVGIFYVTTLTYKYVL